MKVAVIGATGFTGHHISKELANRNIKVLGISRKGSITDTPLINYISMDVMNVAGLAETIKGCDVVVNAFNPGWNNPEIYDQFLKGAQAIQAAVKLSGVKRLIAIGGAGSLYVSPGGPQVIDTVSNDHPFYAGAKAAKDYLEIIKQETDLDWAFFSPALEMHQGITTGRTGRYRLGTDYPVTDENGKNVLSGEDLAVVIADEIEHPKHHQVRFTAAY
ncbi:MULTISPECIES: NAD(P)-dependent oxidoreductase [unclassified Chitinophaga]|uniref:NAD(P)-dependent oxidoreductase n=1 Tax=unclassified Chitinophaga TaxID=2619133 RepID=UPI0009CA0BA8|nr:MULTISPECIES: NAD(P)H-binding protein [unclassified Chitinophaga]OMP76572.1 histidine kinase [[Flexibacter] sp. ATCC 35208]WPV66941.1 NAD(P)H-binding protein [Chitinophaga sp. LS1]